MTSIAETQRRGFSDRLQRIESGGPNTSGTIYLGAMEADGVSYSAKRKARRKFSLKSLFIWPVAAVLGAVAMFAGRITLFHLAASPDVLPAVHADLIMMSADIAIGAVLMLLFAWSFSMGGGVRLMFLTAGFLAVMLGEGMIIKQSPGIFTSFFSKEYVAQSMRGPLPYEAWDETIAALATQRVLLPQGFPTGG